MNTNKSKNILHKKKAKATQSVNIACSVDIIYVVEQHSPRFHIKMT